MPAVQELYRAYYPQPQSLTRIESILLEIELFSRVCEKLDNYYIENNKNYLRLIKPAKEMEQEMYKGNLIRDILKDILSSNEYTIDGIAYYTDTPEEVIHEIMVGRNQSPSLTIARKIIELHRTIRPKLYREILNKIIAEQATVEP